MIGKFATASVLRILILTFLFVGRGLSQAPVTGETPANPATPQQPTTEQPAQTPSSDQEPSEESTSRRKKPKDFKNWNYNVGLGANVDSGTTKTFVRAGGPLGTAGVARNASKYLGLRADFIFSDLPLRQSALSLAQAGSASSYLFAVTLGPVINIPVTKEWGGYLVFGGGYYHRWGTLSDDTTIPGSTCNAFYVWWSSCPNVSVAISGSFVTEDQNHFGYDVGAGVTRKVPSGAELYAEFRLMHGSGNLTTTDVRPITIGVRW